MQLHAVREVEVGTSRNVVQRCSASSTTATLPGARMLQDVHIAEIATHVLTPPEEFDIAAAAHLGSDVIDSLDRGERRLILDFSLVHLVDSAGIGALLSADRRVRAAGGELVIANVSEHVRQVFEVTGVVRSLTVE